METVILDTNEVMLFLYKDVGLLWEHKLTKPEYRDKISLNKNKKLSNFIKQKSETITYYITNHNELNETQKIPINTFILIECSGQTRIGSLLKHIRNSIMHGRYTISFPGDEVILAMEDVNNRNKITMRGNITLTRLKELIDIVS